MTVHSVLIDVNRSLLIFNLAGKPVRYDDYYVMVINQGVGCKQSCFLYV